MALAIAQPDPAGAASLQSCLEAVRTHTRDHPEQPALLIHLLHTCLQMALATPPPYSSAPRGGRPPPGKGQSQRLRKLPGSFWPARSLLECRRDRWLTHVVEAADAGKLTSAAVADLLDL